MPWKEIITIGASILPKIFGGGGKKKLRRLQEQQAAEARQIAGILLNQFGLPQNQQYIDLLFDAIDQEGYSQQSLDLLGEIGLTQDEIGGYVTDSAFSFDNLPPELQGIYNQVLNDSQFVSSTARDIIASGGFNDYQRQAGNFFGNLAQGNLPEYQQAYDFSSGVLSNRGYNPELAQLYNQGQFTFGFGLDPRIDAYQDFGLNLFGNYGQTEQSIADANRFRSTIDAGGMTADLRKLIAAGEGLVRSGGMTPALESILGTLQAQIKSGGLTAEGRKLFSEMMEIIEAGGEGGALLPRGALTSFAADQGASLAKANQEMIQRQAAQRGTGTGAIVGSGLGNRDILEANDQIVANRARMIQEAAVRESEMRLQQLGMASGVAGDVVRGGMGVVGSALGAMGSVAGASAANVGSGLGAIQAGNSIAAQRYGQGIQGLLGVGQQDLERMNLGRQAYMDANQTRQNYFNLGSNLSMQAAGTASNREFQAANNLQNLMGLRAQGASDLANLGQMGYNNMFNAGNMMNIGANMALGGGNLLLAGQGQQLDALLGLGNYYNNAYALQQASIENAANRNANYLNQLGANSRYLIGAGLNTYQPSWYALGQGYPMGNGHWSQALSTLIGGVMPWLNSDGGPSNPPLMQAAWGVGMPPNIGMGGYQIPNIGFGGSINPLPNVSMY